MFLNNILELEKHSIYIVRLLIFVLLPTLILEINIKMRTII